MPEALSDAAKKLLAAIEVPEMNPVDQQKLEHETPPRVRDELMAHLAQRFEPPVTAPVLGRAWAFADAGNRRALEQLYLVNLRSTNHSARAACVRALGRLGYADMDDVALIALRDDHDEVSAAAVEILVKRARTDALVAGLLRHVARARAAQPEFQSTRELLRAHGFDAAP
ncbi:MAG TPA: hypothetical protein VFF06_03250 [Polyangia bacterium]|nr:hypothetical protein [Polyangia bacterium]